MWYSQNWHIRRSNTSDVSTIQKITCYVTSLSHSTLTKSQTLLLYRVHYINVSKKYAVLFQLSEIYGRDATGREAKAPRWYLSLNGGSVIFSWEYFGIALCLSLHFWQFLLIKVTFSKWHFVHVYTLLVERIQSLIPLCIRHCFVFNIRLKCWITKFSVLQYSTRTLMLSQRIHRTHVHSLL